MSLSDKCLSIDSHAMGVDTPCNEYIASRVQSRFSTPRRETFISSSFSFQTNLSRNSTHNGDFDQKNRSQSSFSLSTKPSNADTASSLLMLANSSMTTTTSVESSMESNNTSFPQVPFSFLPKEYREVNMEWALQMRPFIHIFQPHLASYTTDECFKPWLEFLRHIHLFISAESNPK